MIGRVVSSEEDVLEANRRFYQALSDLDLDAMASVWLEEPWVRCVHPGWPMLSGWDDVMESWKRIFDNTATASGESGQRLGAVVRRDSLVLCLERIAASSSAAVWFLSRRVRISFSRRRRAGGWCCTRLLFCR